MSKPDIVPNQSAAGIAVDPRTLERVIPESKRADGSVRKERRIRPGFTPQEDVSRFRSTRQKAMDTNKLPAGHILGWLPPSQTKSAASGASRPGAAPGSGSAQGETKPSSKSAAKNAKRKAKKQAEKEKVIQENWEDSDEDDETAQKGRSLATKRDEVAAAKGDAATGEDNDDKEGEKLAKELEKLDVQ